MISIFFLPITFYLIYRDQKTGIIELYYWKILFPFTFTFLIFYNPQKIFLVMEIFAKYGIIFLIFLLFFVSIKIYGGADVLFLLFLLFSATNQFLIEIYFNFFVFLNNLAVLAIVGMFNRGLFMNERQLLKKYAYFHNILELPTRNRSKFFFAPQFFFIFFTFL